MGFNKVHWIVDEVWELEIKIAFCFKNTDKDVLITEEDGKH